MNDDIRPDVAQDVAEGMIVAAIEHVQRDIRRMQQFQPLVDDPQIEIPVLLFRTGRVQREAVIHRQAVDDVHVGAGVLQPQGETVADEASPADQHDLASVQHRCINLLAGVFL